MTDSAVDLHLLDPAQAARIAASSPAPEDRWAEGFPREDDSAPASIVAKADPSPGVFGVYTLVPRAHGRVIGTAGFFGPPNESGEVTIGYGMVEPEWGQGYGTEAVAALVAVCRTHGGVTAVNADTDLDNIGSQRVLLKNGFTRTHADESLEYYVLRLDS
ncbi:GNAT family N-acetyltransferase [Kitasatospora sp. NPDC006697]|uniref:GNAT family N-acetyltransferase n=1 Tax=Kitasatospora sp. NPDC006697 TaxID=3364020 RepID=UPI003691E535